MFAHLNKSSFNVSQSFLICLSTSGTHYMRYVKDEQTDVMDRGFPILAIISLHNNESWYLVPCTLYTFDKKQQYPSLLKCRF